MKKILLIGASGQLGTRIFRKLTEAGNEKIRILVRKDSRYQHLLSAEPEVFVGDLRDVGSLRPALQDVDTVIITANSAAPRKKEDGYKTVDTQGILDLIRESRKSGVNHIIFTSIKPLPPKLDQWLLLARAKREVEKHLISSDLNYTILQPDAFMDVYFSFLGTDLPARGDEAPLIHRDFRFMQTFFNSIRNDIAQGRIGIIGDGKVRHSYIAVDDVATFIVKAVDEPSMLNQVIPLGGPAALSTLEVKKIFEKVLDRKLKIKRTPAFMMKLLGNLMGPFAPNAANIMRLNYIAATAESIIDSSALAEKLGIRLTTAEEFLRQKLALERKANQRTADKKIMTKV
jgi:NADH dehydrogenase